MQRPIIASPSLVVLALGVRLHVVLALKPFRAFNTEMPPETWEILCILGRLVLRQMTGRVDVGANLVVVSAVG